MSEYEGVFGANPIEHFVVLLENDELQLTVVSCFSWDLPNYNPVWQSKSFKKEVEAEAARDWLEAIMLAQNLSLAGLWAIMRWVRFNGE